DTLRGHEGDDKAARRRSLFVREAAAVVRRESMKRPSYDFMSEPPEESQQRISMTVDHFRWLLMWHGEFARELMAIEISRDGRRPQARDLRPVDRLLQEARRRQQVREARRRRHDEPGADDVLRAGIVARQSRQAGSVSRDRAKARTSTRTHRRRGAQAGARRQ